MRPKPWPPTNDSEEWKTWPSLHTLQASAPALTVHQMRGILVDVVCYRCADNTVRYEPGAAASAVREAVTDDELDALEEEDDTKQPRRELTLMALYREQLRSANESRREFRENAAENRREFRETINAMVAPMKLGIQLVETNAVHLAAQLEGHQKNWDKVLMLIQDLMDRQLERDLAIKRDSASVDLKNKTFGLLREEAPKLVETFRSTHAGKEALEFLSTLDADLVDVAAAQGLITAQQLAMLKRVRKAAPPAPNHQDAQNHQGHPPTES